MSARAKTVFLHIRSAGIVLACLIFLTSALPYAAAQDENAHKTVRVGWYDSPYYRMDEAGRKTGYAYEYQRKIAAYTGWTYEYVTDSWAGLMDKLVSGEIDLMSDITYTEERSHNMLFPDFEMGSEEYLLYLPINKADQFQDDFSYFDGKKVGVNKGSVQIDYYKEWEKKQKISTEIIELTNTEDEAVEMLTNGELDGFVTLDNYSHTEDMIPVAKVGYSKIYFAVSKSRTDLLDELNAALRSIQNEDRFYNNNLYAKYIRNAGSHLFLDKDEKNWLSEHGDIRVGYLDNYLAFCAKDEETGELTGALKDYLEEASDCLSNAKINFKTFAYPNVAEAMQALKDGSIDCIFPCNFSIYYGEQKGILLTPALAESTLYTLARSDDKKSFMPTDKITTAIEKDNHNYDSILLDFYPKWQTLVCDGVQNCLKAVSDGKADCVLISSYRYNNLRKLCEQYHLIAWDTGNNISSSIAVNETDTELYSILDKIVNIVPGTTINMALTQYFSEDQKSNISLLEFVRKYLLLVIAVVVLILSMLMMIIVQRRLIIAEQNAKKHREIADDLSKRIYVDALTSVGNKGGFDNHIKMLRERIASGEVTEFAICMFDCDDLKYINDRYGHEKGDEYLIAAVRMIGRIFRNSSVFRVGGDEFCAILSGEDLQNCGELAAKFDSESRANNSAVDNEWEQVNVSVGTAVYDARVDNSIEDTIARADRIMYENKRKRKAERGVR